MTTLIIPCAGKSSRFPNMKPKWLLTHPNGSLMIFSGLSKFPTDKFSRIIVTIHRSHITDYDAEVLLTQAATIDFEICVLDEWTTGPAETIYKTIEIMEISDGIVVKDSDNLVSYNFENSYGTAGNYVVGVDIAHQNISKPESKSFLVVNDQNLVVDIIEKRIISNMICAGVYGISDVAAYKDAFNSCKAVMDDSEIYISHIISNLIKLESMPFAFVKADDFEDWGTFGEWKKVQHKHATYFSDFDGVLVRNTGKYGSINWDSDFAPIEENLQTLRNLSEQGAQIVITTSRNLEFKDRILEFLLSKGVNVHEIVLGLSHSPRFLINDFAPTNPYPSAIALNIPRNAALNDYLQS